MRADTLVHSVQSLVATTERSGDVGGSWRVRIGLQRPAMKRGAVGEMDGRNQYDDPRRRLILVRYRGRCAHRGAERRLGSVLLGEMEAIRAVALAVGAHVRHHGHFHRHVVCPNDRQAHPDRDENGEKQHEALSERPTIHGGTDALPELCRRQGRRRPPGACGACQSGTIMRLAGSGTAEVRAQEDLHAQSRRTFMRRIDESERPMRAESSSATDRRRGRRQASQYNRAARHPSQSVRSAREPRENRCAITDDGRTRMNLRRPRWSRDPSPCRHPFPCRRRFPRLSASFRFRVRLCCGRQNLLIELGLASGS
jgi:hypothetical protein